MRSRTLLLSGLVILILAALVVAWPFLNKNSRAAGAVNVFASPVQAGCYIAAPNDCRIHVDPFTINIAATKKLVLFHLVAIPAGGGPMPVLYDFHTDLSNPAPASGTTYSPSLVTQDFAATCGKSYQLSLQGQDSGDAGTSFNLGMTTQFTCPSVVP